jgi:hypothetical protein
MNSVPYFQDSKLSGVKVTLSESLYFACLQ